MRKEIEIVNGAVQYGNLGQLKSSEVILHFIFDDKPLSIRADVAIDYMLNCYENIKTCSYPKEH